MAAFDRRRFIALLRSLARRGYSAVRRPRFARSAAADRGAVVFAGDSLIDRWTTLAEDFPALKVANRGISGDTSRDLLDRFQKDVLSCRPRAVVILIGTNDLSAGDAPERVLERLRGVLALAAGTPVVVCRVLPRTKEPGRFPEEIRELNALIDRLPSNAAICDAFTALADADGGPREGFFVDGLHLTSAGYRALKAALAPHLADFSASAGTGTIGRMTANRPRKEPWRWALGLLLAFTFVSFFLVPNRVQSLRRRLASQLPDQWAKVSNNGPFRVVLPYKDLGYTDEGLYAARSRQIVLHGLPYGPWLGSRTLRSWIFDALMFYPAAAGIWAAGGNLALGWTLTHAVVGCGWILMLFLVFRAHTKDEAYSLMFASLIFFFSNTFTEAANLFIRAFRHPSTLVPKLANLPSSLFLPNSLYGRLPSPSVSFLWIAAVLALFTLISRSEKRRPAAAAAVGAAGGLLCLIHFFEWLAGVMALCLLAAELWRDRGTPRTGRFNAIVSASVAAVVSGAYYVFAKIMTADTMHDVIDLNSTWERAFNPLSIPFLLAAALFYALARRRDGARRSVFLAAAAIEAACFVTANLSLVLGYDMQFGEHAAYAAGFAAILAGACWVMEHDRLRKLLVPHAYVLTAFFCAWFAFKSKAWADTHYKMYGIPQDVAAAYAWMNENVPKDSMLLALSAPVNFLTPLEAEMRSTVSFAQLAGEPVTTESNLRAFAAMLKTLGAAPERFRQERWRIGDAAERARAAQLEDYTGDLDWEDREKMLWPFFLRLDTTPDPEDPRRAEAWRRILAYHGEAEPMRQPFYAWVQKGDVPLLRRTPEESGGRLLYRNPSVSLYLFPAGARN